MNANLRKFLDERADPHGPTFLERMAELISVNGGLNVSGWGVTQSGGTYGRQGLNQGEALELLKINGFLLGVVVLLGKDEVHELEMVIVTTIGAHVIQEEEDRRVLAELMGEMDAAKT